MSKQFQVILKEWWRAITQSNRTIQTILIGGYLLSMQTIVTQILIIGLSSQDFTGTRLENRI